MTNPIWPIGPAKCVDDNKYGVYIVGEHGNYYVGVAWSAPDGGTFHAMWRKMDGKNATGHRSLDLLPPKLTRDEAIAEAFASVHPDRLSVKNAQIAVITHWEKLKAEGRVE
jgi:hypothetical protein